MKRQGYSTKLMFMAMLACMFWILTSPLTVAAENVSEDQYDDEEPSWTVPENSDPDKNYPVGEFDETGSGEQTSPSSSTTETSPGNSAADLGITVNGGSVTVTSDKDISNIKFFDCDGNQISEENFADGNSTITRDIPEGAATVSAKSGTTEKSAQTGTTDCSADDGDQPADDQPADDETPADDQPADDQPADDKAEVAIVEADGDGTPATDEAVAGTSESAEEGSGEVQDALASGATEAAKGQPSDFAQEESGTETTETLPDTGGPTLLLPALAALLLGLGLLGAFASRRLHPATRDRD